MKALELKNVLFDYVRKYDLLEEELLFFESNNLLYKEVIKNLSKCMSEEYSEILELDFLLETLFGNRYNNLQKNISICEKLKFLNRTGSEEYKRLRKDIVRIISEIKMEYFNHVSKMRELSQTLYSMKKKMISARRVISSLKYNQIISGSDIYVVKNILFELGYDEKEVALSVETLFLENKFFESRQDGKYYSNEEKYKFINLLSLGGEVFSYPIVENEDKLDKISCYVCSILKDLSHDINEDNIKDILPTIGREVKDEKELEFVLIGVLEKIRKWLDEEIDLIKDPDFIMNISIKNEIASECYRIINQYNLIRNYLDNNLYVNDDLDLEEADEVLTDSNEKNNVFYLVSKNNKCYFEDDLEEMPSEYISKTLELIEKFKNNSLGKKKNKVLFSRKGFSELKDDQIRIIYKRIKGDDYLIYGVFVKKSDRTPKSILDGIVDRSGVISENPEEIELRLKEFVEINGRKWVTIQTC